MKAARILLALAFVGGAGAFFLHVMTRDDAAAVHGRQTEKELPPTGRKPMLLETSASCRPCHPEVYAEWSRSHHAIAYTNPEVQRLSRQFQDRDCLPCHLPRPVFETGLGVRVLERSTRKNEGVDCFTCHRSGNAMLCAGEVGPGGADAPCNPETWAPVASMTLCAPCHDQHKVLQDWKQTRFAVEGPGYQDCNDCHMPRVKRAQGRSGRGHVFPGAHDPEMIRKAATMQVTLGGSGLLLVRVENTGAGHNFPADERHRAVDLEIEVEDGSGRSARFRVDRYRNPYREEFAIKNPLREPGAERDYEVEIQGLGTAAIHALRVPAEHQPHRKTWYPESTQIPAGEARSYRIELPAEVRSARVLLLFRTNPYQSDEDAVLVAEEKVSLR